MQILDLIFNGPYKAFLRHERLMPLYLAFQEYLLDRAAALANKTAEPKWVPPVATVAMCIKSTLAFVASKNVDEPFKASVEGLFVKVGQWYSDEDTLEFINLNLSELTIGPKAASTTVTFGGGEDVIDVDDGHDSMMAPPEFKQHLRIERRPVDGDGLELDDDLLNDAQQPEEQEVAADDAVVDAAAAAIMVPAGREPAPPPAVAHAAAGVFVAALRGAVARLPHIPLLSDEDIDRLAERPNGPKLIGDALKARGDQRKTGFTRSKLKAITKELKDFEAQRRVGAVPAVVAAAEVPLAVPLEAVAAAEAVVPHAGAAAAVVAAAAAGAMEVDDDEGANDAALQLNLQNFQRQEAEDHPNANTPADYKLCVCKKTWDQCPQGGKMIMCTVATCKGKWFHCACMPALKEYSRRDPAPDFVYVCFMCEWAAG